MYGTVVVVGATFFDIPPSRLFGDCRHETLHALVSYHVVQVLQIDYRLGLLGYNPPTAIGDQSDQLFRYRVSLLLERLRHPIQCGCRVFDDDVLGVTRQSNTIQGQAPERYVSEPRAGKVDVHHFVCRKRLPLEASTVEQDVRQFSFKAAIDERARLEVDLDQLCVAKQAPFERRGLVHRPTQVGIGKIDPSEDVSDPVLNAPERGVTQIGILEARVADRHGPHAKPIKFAAVEPAVVDFTAEQPHPLQLAPAEVQIPPLRFVDDETGFDLGHLPALKLEPAYNRRVGKLQATQVKTPLFRGQREPIERLTLDQPIPDFEVQ